MRFKSIFGILLFIAFNQVLVAQNYSIKGKIKNGATDEMVNGAAITLRGTAYADLSKNGGEFTIEHVHKDKFVLNIVVSGYQSYQSQINLKNNLDLGTITLFPLGYQDPNAGALQKTIRATNIAELFVNRPNFIGGNAVFGIPPEPKKLIGNFYLDPKWSKASILLYQDKEVMEGYLVRYNINSNMFEIKTEEMDQISMIPGHRIQNIVWIDSEHNVPRYFVNGMDFKDEGSPISGFFEVLVDGEMPLVRRTKATIRESNYNPALMVGHRDDQIMKRNTYYYIKDKNIYEIPKKRKRLFSIFGEKEKEIQSFALENNVNLKEKTSLFVLFTKFNSQFEGFDPILPDPIEQD